jgi:hypothetical protein
VTVPRLGPPPLRVEYVPTAVQAVGTEQERAKSVTVTDPAGRGMCCSSHLLPFQDSPKLSSSLFLLV